MTDRTRGNITPNKVNSGTVNATTLKRNGSLLRPWKVLHQASSFTDKTFNTDAYHLVKLELVVASSCLPAVEVDGSNSNNDYNYLQLSSSGITSVTGDNRFELHEAATSATTSEWVFGIRPSENDRYGFYGGASVNDLSKKSTMRGSQDNSGQDLDSFRVFSHDGSGGVDTQEIIEIIVSGKNLDT